MKLTTKALIVSLQIVATFAAVAQNDLNQVPKYPMWQVTLQVADETGASVSNATAYVTYYVPRAPLAPSQGARKSGLTDLQGLFSATESSSGLIGYGAEKEGYYPSTGMEYEFQKKEGDKWTPWNPIFQILLKKIGNPIPMYAKSVNLGVPVQGKPIGFDLMIGDWVEPFGKGSTADLVFELQTDKKSDRDFDSTLTITFSNPSDGIQTFIASEPIGEGSALRSPHEAPVDGYESKLIERQSEHPGQPSTYDRDKNRNYFFRVRTTLDEHGGVKNAFYGKIYGDFMQFHYFLNPTPNDRNIEFDPKQNLMQDLKSSEQVHEP